MPFFTAPNPSQTTEPDGSPAQRAVTLTVHQNHPQEHFKSTDTRASPRDSDPVAGALVQPWHLWFTNTIQVTPMDHHHKSPAFTRPSLKGEPLPFHSHFFLGQGTDYVILLLHQVSADGDSLVMLKTSLSEE